MLYYFVAEKGYSLKEMLSYNDMEMALLKAIFEVKMEKEKKNAKEMQRKMRKAKR